MDKYLSEKVIIKCNSEHFEDIKVTNDNFDLFSKLKVGDTIGEKTFHFENVTINFQGSVRKTIITSKVIKIYENGKYLIDFKYHSDLNTEGGLNLKFVYSFNDLNRSIVDINHRWYLMCGHDVEDKYFGQIHDNFFQKIQHATFYVQGRVKKCKTQSLNMYSN